MSLQSKLLFQKSLRLTKRDFLKYTSGVLSTAILPYPYQLALAKEHWDVIIIGGGTAGLPAAIFAAQKGLKVLVIEKASVIGGTLFLSTGQIAGAGTVFQQQKGIMDSPDQHYDDIMRINGNTSDPDLTRIVAENAGTTINWLAANGYKIFDHHPVTKIAHDPFKVERYIQGPMGGISILNAIKPIVDQEITKGNITVLLETSAVDLMQSKNGAITGVITQNKEGQLMDYKGHKVILASGGCASNPDLYEELHNVPLYCQMAYPNSQGIGLILGQSVGGYLRGGEKYSPLYGMILTDDNIPSTMYGLTKNIIERLPWEILVNSKGKRFVQEDHESVDAIEHAIMEQPAHRHWAILDQNMIEEMPQLIYGWPNKRIMTESKKQNMIKQYGSIRELAIKSELPALNLESTVQEYNDNLENNRDDTLGRQHRPLPIEKPPFYSIRMSGWSLCSFAGLAINKNFEVIKPSGEPINNLYAIGEVIGFGATSGNAYVNGMGVTPAITYGKLLGESIRTI